MQFRVNFLISILISLAHPAWSNAKVIKLFRCKDAVTSAPVKDYNQLIMQIRIGDRLVFCDEKTYTIKGLAGVGNRTIIFRTAERTDAVLRVSLSSYFIALLQETIDASAKLSELQLPHPEVLGFAQSQYVLVEDLGRDLITFEDWALKKTRGIPDEFLQKAYLAFAKKTAHVTKIHDSHWKNIAYSVPKQEWLFLDFCNDIECANHIELITPAMGAGVHQSPLKQGFTQLQKSNQIPDFRKKKFRKYRIKIMNAISEERKLLFFANMQSICNDVLKGISQFFQSSQPQSDSQAF